MLRGRVEPSRWPLWSLNWPAAAFIVATTVVVHAGTAIAVLLSRDVELRHLELGGLITGLAVVHAEMQVDAERIRHRTSQEQAPRLYNDLCAVWTFAGALLLPAALSAAVTFLITLHFWLRVMRRDGALAYRVGLTRSSLMLACFAVGTLFNALGGDFAADRTGIAQLGLVLVAAVLYTSINAGLLTAAIVLAVPGTSVRRVLRGMDHTLELTTISLGAVIATLLVGPVPWMTVLALPALLVLHRGIRAQELERDAGRDHATGLLNGPGWHREARRELRRAARRQQTVGLLLIDMDSFREVNERYGHLTGNAVLTAIGRTLAGAAREDDLIGRHGGEEFVVLLPAVEDELLGMAELLRDKIAALEVPVVEIPDGVGSVGLSDGPRRGRRPATATVVRDLSASIGVARFPDDGFGMEELLSAVDRALLDAKRLGHGQIALRSTRAPDGLSVFRRTRERFS